MSVSSRADALAAPHPEARPKQNSEIQFFGKNSSENLGPSGWDPALGISELCYIEGRAFGRPSCTRFEVGQFFIQLSKLKFEQT